MERSEIYKSIRQIVELNLPGSRTLLFGSRARGDDDRYSDYDLLIITPSTFPDKEKIYWSTLLNHAIVKALQIPVDLLINSEEEVTEKQALPGHVVRTAIREGINI
ncbi:MAG: nucleotidyltransferase domain-containing protein [Mucilaginibacter sp.]|nr:nucleotidyltransferase domain-containing protein [Mucilaginibacter sp.]